MSDIDALLSDLLDSDDERTVVESTEDVGSASRTQRSGAGDADAAEPPRPPQQEARAPPERKDARDGGVTEARASGEDASASTDDPLAGLEGAESTSLLDLDGLDADGPWAGDGAPPPAQPVAGGGATPPAEPATAGRATPPAEPATAGGASPFAEPLTAAGAPPLAELEVDGGAPPLAESRRDEGVRSRVPLSPSPGESPPELFPSLVAHARQMSDAVVAAELEVRVAPPTARDASLAAQDAFPTGSPEASRAARSGAPGSPGTPKPKGDEEDESATRRGSILEAGRALETRLTASDLGSVGDLDRIRIDSETRDELLLSSMDIKLSGFDSGWGVEGWSDDRTSVGCQGATRAFVLPGFEGFFRGAQTHGTPSCTTKYLSFVAIGTSNGDAFVLIPGSGGKAARVVAARDPAAGHDPLTCVALGQASGALVLLGGHASGTLRVWELRSTAGVSTPAGPSDWTLARTLQGLHASAVLSCAVLGTVPGAPSWALSGDAHGRVIAHNLTKHLSVASQALTSFARSITGNVLVPSHALHFDLPNPGPGAGTHLIRPLASQRDLDAVRCAGPVGRAAPPARPPPDGVLAHPTRGHYVLVVIGSVAAVVRLAPADCTPSAVHAFLPPRPRAERRTQGPREPAYGAWALARRGADGDPLGPGATVRVAIGWGRSLAVYEAEIVSANEDVQAPLPGQRAPPPRPPLRPSPPEYVGGSFVRGPICGLAFTDRGPLIVSFSLDDTVTGVVALRRDALTSAPDAPRPEDPALDLGIDRFSIRDWVVGFDPSGVAGGGAQLYHASMSGSGDQVLLLGSQGIRVLHLMTWQQRASAFTSARRWGAALLTSARLLVTQELGVPDPGGDTAWPADVPSPGEGTRLELARYVSSLLVGLLDSTLEGCLHEAVESGALVLDGAGEGGDAETARAARADAGGVDAETADASGADARPAVESASSPSRARREPSPAARRRKRVADLADASIVACLLLRDSDLLSSGVFGRFRAQRATNVFLAALVPHALAGRVPHLGPEVVQALVEWCVQRGSPGIVERCVIHFDVAALDLNQLIPLCIKRGLHFALADIFARALQDWQTPAQLLLVAAAAAADPGEPGTALSPAGSGVRSDLLSPAGSASRDAPLSPARPASDDAPDEASRSPVRPSRGGADGPPAESEAPALAGLLLRELQACLLGTPYPPGVPPRDAEGASRARAQVASFLLHSDSLSVWEAWKQWTRVAGILWPRTLPRSICDPYPSLGFLLAVDAWSTLAVVRGVLRVWDALEEDLIELVPGLDRSFVVLDLPRGRTVAQAFVDAVACIAGLEGCRRGSAEGDAPPAPDAAPSRRRASDLDAVLDFFVELTSSGRVAPSPRVAAWILLRLAKRRCNALDEELATKIVNGGAALADADRDEVIATFSANGWHRAAARLQHLAGRQRGAFESLLRCETHPEAAAAYAQRLLVDGAVDAQERARLLDAFVASSPALVHLSAEAAAAFFLNAAPEAQRRVIERLSGQPELQHAYLHALLDLRRGLRAELRGADTADASGADAAVAVDAREAAAAGLLEIPDVADLVVSLLCRYDRAAVLPFLRSNGAFRLDPCLEAARTAGCRDAEAFLLERRGDMAAALGIYVADVRAADEALLGSVSAGGRASPAEFATARRAMEAARAMCARFSLDHAPPPGTPAAAAPSGQVEACRRLWMSLLSCYATALDDARALVRARPSGGADDLCDFFTGLTEEVIKVAASYVPLSALASSIIDSHAGGKLGAFRRTILMMMRASEGELNLMRSVNHCAGSDGFAVLRRGYELCSAARVSRPDAASGAASVPPGDRPLQGPRRWAARGRGDAGGRMAELIQRGAALGGEVLARVKPPAVTALDPSPSPVLSPSASGRV